MEFVTNQLIWAFTLAFTLYAGWLDSSTRRIPNWLTVPGLGLGVAVHFALAGRHGAALAIEGAGLGLLVLLPMVFLRAMGAGDWKLMGAIGAWVGPLMLVFVLLASILVAGLMAVVQMIRAKRVKKTVHNVGVLVMDFATFGFRPHPEMSLDNPEALKLPFGVAAAIGTFVCFIAAHWSLRG